MMVRFSGFRDEDPYRRVNREDPYRENPYQRREDVYGRVATTNGRFNDVAGGGWYFGFAQIQ